MVKSKHSRYNPLYTMITVVMENAFFDRCKRYLSGRIIDIGCGEKPFKDLLSGIVSEHVGVDHHDTVHDRSNIDIFGTAYHIPVEDASFDGAICTAVLEHLEEPEMALRECYRVLKKGAHAIYTVPLFYPVHEAPRDFYRFTNFGLKYLFEKVGFTIVEIHPLSGFALTFLQLHLKLVKNKLDRGIIKKLRLVDIYIYLCSKLGLFLNKYDNTKIYTWMYLVVARK